MKRLLLTILLVMSITLVACKGSSNNKKDNKETSTNDTKSSNESKDSSDIYSSEEIKEIASDLLNSKAFIDELSEIPEHVAIKQYKLSDSSIPYIISYQSTGATAEEITFISTEDDITDYINDHINAQLTAFESYNPAEVSKIKDHIIAKLKNYTVIIVTSDNDKIEDVLKKYTQTEK